MVRTTESDYADQLAELAKEAEAVEASQADAEEAERQLIVSCSKLIHDGVPVLYVARAANINRTRLYRLLGRLPVKGSA